MHIALIARLILAILCAPRSDALTVYLGGGEVNNVEDVKKDPDWKELFLSKRRILEEGRLDRLHASINIESDRYGIGSYLALNASQCSRNIIYPSFGVYNSFLSYFSKRLRTSFSLAAGLSLSVLRRDSILFFRENRGKFLRQLAKQWISDKFASLKYRIKGGISELGFNFPEFVNGVAAPTLNSFNFYALKFINGAARAVTIVVDPTHYVARAKILKERLSNLVNTASSSMRGGIGAVKAHLNNDPRIEEGRIVLFGPYVALRAQFKRLQLYIRFESELFVDGDILKENAEAKYKWPVMFSLLQLHFGFNIKLFDFYQ